jgi:hypothetical protein
MAIENQIPKQRKIKFRAFEQIEIWISLQARDGQNFTEVEQIFRAFEQIEFLLPLLDISLFNFFPEIFHI